MNNTVMNIYNFVDFSSYFLRKVTEVKLLGFAYKELEYILLHYPLERLILLMLLPSLAE